jgi:hypothetical protein
MTGEIAEQLLPIWRLRAFPRVVKRKMSSFGVNAPAIAPGHSRPCRLPRPS